MTEENKNTDPTSWRFYTTPPDMWDDMYRDCRNATTSIEFEQYIIENDEVGQRFMRLFTEKAKEGLKIFVICDAYGSALLNRSPWVRKLRRHGGSVHFYNAYKGIEVLMVWRWFPRTHAKTMLIDSSIAYTGGMCIAERMRSWRDTHVRITGPVVKQIRHYFDDIESRIKRRKWRRMKAPAPADPHFQYFVNRPAQERREVYRQLQLNVLNADKYIYIASAYFVPNRKFVRLLRRARAKGADVRIIIPAKSDVPLADLVTLSYMPRFLRAGLRIYHYNKTLLHSKMAIIDDKWATVGSSNFDVLSFFFNREANLMITEPAAVTELKQHFFDDIRYSTEMTWARWREIPLWKKVVGFMGRALRLVLK